MIAEFETFIDIMQEAEDKVAQYVQTLKEVQPEDLGLDRRAGYRLYVADDGIISTRSGDNSLQYYGGFEYVEKHHRFELGDWIFYSADSSRVQSCLDRWEYLNREDEEEVEPY